MLDSPDMRVSPEAEPAPREDAAPHSQFLDLLERRRSVSPLRLCEPAPNSDELRRVLTVALRVPEHGALEPWRIILVQGRARQELGDGLAAAYLEANAHQEAAAAELGVRKINAVFAAAPLVVVVVSCTDASARIPEWEQILSAGAVCMNLMTAASALGYGSTWLSGWAAYDPAALKVIRLGPNEKVAGVIPIGAIAETPNERGRPSLERVVTLWETK
jgi:nitroreductase